MTVNADLVDASTAPRPTPRVPGFQRRAVGWALRYGVYFVFLALCGVVSLVTPHFLSGTNISNLFAQSSAIGIVSVGMTFVLIVRGIDVSVGATLALASAVGTSEIAFHGWSWPVAVLAMLAVGVAVGAFNGFSTAYLRMPAFLVTLATLTIGGGLATTVSGGQSIYQLPTLFAKIGASKLGPIPVPVLFFVVVVAIGHLVLSRTLFGRWVYAVGGNPAAARVAGIPVRRVITSAFVISGLCAAIAGFLLTCQLASFTTDMGTDYEFTAIAAVVIGGTSLFGGKGTMGGTLVGVLILQVINNALNLLDVSPYYVDAVQGAIIFIAVLVDTLRTRYIERYSSVG